MPHESIMKLIDENEVRNLSHRYAQAIDRGDAVAWSALFTKDAEFKRAGRPPLPYEGILELPATQLRRYAKTWHGVQTQNITLHGEEAEGEVYCIARHIYTDYHNVPGVFPFSLVHDLLVRYQDVYRKEDGVWRIRSREINIDLREVRQVTLFNGVVEPGDRAPSG